MLRPLCLSFICIALSISSLAQDLILEDISIKKSFDRYEHFEGSVKVTNTGIVAIKRYNVVEAVISTDSIYDNNDTVIGYASLDTISAAESREITFTGYNSNEMNVEPGNYFIILTADRYGHVIETDETNNRIVLPGITVNASNVDLTFVGCTINNNIIARNDRARVSYAIENNGSTNIQGAIYTTFYLSGDSVLSSDDKYIDYFAIYFIEADSGVHAAELVFPGVSAGNYYFIGKVDDLTSKERYAETEETNNTIIIPVAVINNDVDLKITQLDGYASYNNDWNFTALVSNTGSTGAGDFEIDIYFSTDANLSSDDVLVNYGYTSDYVAAKNATWTYDFGPVWLSPGPYYIIGHINANHSIPETDYDNNIMVGAYVYVSPPPTKSYIITEAMFLEEYDVTDTELKLGVSLLNTGESLSAYQHFQITISDSTNTTRHIEYVFEAIYASPGLSITKNWTLNLNTTLPVGTYDVTISCFGECYTPAYQLELIINNAMYDLNGSVQGEDGTPITKGKLFLYQKNNDVVKFINKVVPTTGTDFSFRVDQNQHTLYFIPDRVEFPSYSPTILGKTVTLTDKNFLTLHADTSALFEIIKLKPLMAGGRSIKGSLFQESGSTGGRIASLIPGEDIPMLLLSEEGDVVAVAYTDDSGNYDFSNLPAQRFKLVIAFEPDKNISFEPIEVNVTNANANVSIEVTAEEISTSVTTEPVITGTENRMLSEHGKFYPNPVSDKIVLINDECYETVEFSDVTGKSIEILRLTCGSQEVSVEKLSAGFYTLKLVKKGQSEMYRFCKQ